MEFKSMLKQWVFIYTLSKKDFRTRYIGSYLGIVWAFVQPLVQVLIFWFVFQVGFKSVPVDDFPFILWLITAMVPWFFFSDAVIGGTNSIIDNSYLVKKVVFRVSTLPVVKILSALYVHLFFMLFLFVMFAIYGYYPMIYNIQILYYSLATIVLTLGLVLVTSSLAVFLKDISQFVAMLMQIGFWLTPIFYSLKTIPERYHVFYKFNPLMYITEGYRNSFIYKKWFWQSPAQTITFWITSLIILSLGILIYKKVRPHFNDVI